MCTWMKFLISLETWHYNIKENDSENVPNNHHPSKKLRSQLGRNRLQINKIC